MVLVAVAATLVTACRGSDDDSSDARLDGLRTAAAVGTFPASIVDIDGTPRDAEPITRCDDDEAAGDRAATLRSGDLERTYIAHIPPGYDGFDRLPLVLNLHGYGSNAQNQAAYSRLPQKADEVGFIVVTPDGAGTPQQWNNLQLDELPDDVAFIGELLDHLEATLCIDPERVYATGISNGSAFAQRLACLMPDRIAAVAAVAAFVYPVVCNGAPPVPIIAFHGTADRCVPYEGGVTTCGRGNLPVPAVETAAANWARHNGCATEPARSQVTEHVRAIAYSECDENVAVVLYAVEGGGHTWPGSVDVERLGAVTTEIDATELMSEFFAAH
jgi:polyhydroxybutyrate depolymerase